MPCVALSIRIRGQLLYREYWKKLLECAEERTILHQGSSLDKNSYLIRPILGVQFMYVFNREGYGVQIEVPCGKEEKIVPLYALLERNKDKVSSKFKKQLLFLPNNGTTRCKILAQLGESTIFENEAEWPEMQENMIECMVEFEKVFLPLIKEFKANL